MKRLISVLLVGAVALAQEKASYTVSDIVLLGLGERHVVFYDSQNTFSRKIEGSVTGRNQSLELKTPSQDTRGFVIKGSLEVSGFGSWQLPISSSLPAFSASRFGERMLVKANTDLRSLYLWNGKNWFTVAERLKAGQQINTIPTPRDSLFGAGSLWRDEAEALQNYLKPRGAFLLATLPETSLDGNESRFLPAPASARRSVLAVQLGFEGMWLFQNNPAPQIPVLDVTASGPISSHRDNDFLARVDSSTDDFTRTWQLAFGGQNPVPAAPKIDFFNRRMVTVFLGRRPTAGYGLVYKSSSLERGALRIVLEQRTPNGAVSNTPSSPFIMLEVAAQDFSSVQIQLVNP
jgi:hypothetical protein